ncbi:MAG: lamin tail domain-containing protein [Phycisphaerae bacterium]|nr:lamin tail domain-containing protein [Phycisphaerae bacterium]
MKRTLAFLGLLYSVVVGTAGAYENRDIGGVTAAGSLRVNGGTYTVRANGSDIWGSADEFHYVYVPLAGDGEMSARVANLHATDSWTKAGVMIRATLNPGSTYAYMCVTGWNGAAFQWRPTANSGNGLGNMMSGGIMAPYWVRIVRKGNTFKAYHSPDGQNWRHQGDTTIPMPANVYMGLAVTSHTSGALCTAVFDNVTGFGPVWKALNVYPRDGARQVAPEAVVLQWQAAPEAPGPIDHFNVYLSNDAAALGQAQSLIATVNGAAATQVTTGKLATGTMYYWRVDSIINDANAAEGEVWHFTTLVEPVEVCTDADINGDCRVDFGDLLLIAQQWLDGPGCEGHAHCADLSGEHGVNLDDFVRLAAQWRASVGPVVINEIHYDPPVKTELAEFVELHNVTKQPIDLSGWSLTSGVNCVLPPGTWIGAGGYVVIAQDAEKFEARFGFAPDGVFTGKLSNDGETVRLRNPAREIIDEVTYKLGFPWPTVGDLPGNSIQLINPGIDNDLGGSWRSAPPSPGEVNVVLSTHMPPHMRQVKHSPQAPGSNEPVTITVKVTDDDGVASVMLSYQAVDPSSYIAIKDPAYHVNWVSVAMYDDGTNGDVLAGDSIYTVIMPASMQVHRRLVRYRITAVDALGLAITGPYADDPCPNFAYFVYDGAPPWRAAINPWAGQPEYITYGADVMRSLPVYHLISKKTDVETATWFEHYEGSEYKWQGTLVYDGQVYDHIRYRMRGGVWRYAMGKNMWKFDFNRGHSFQARDDYGQEYGTKWRKLNLSACIQQGSFGQRGEQGMFEALSFKLFNLAGCPAPRTHWLHFRVVDDLYEDGTLNPAHPPITAGGTQYDGDFWGLYMAIEQMDGRFLDEHGLPDGNLFKMEAGYGELNNQGPLQPDDFSDMRYFKDTFESSPPQDWWVTHINLDHYSPLYAVYQAVRHGDITNKNHFFYNNPEPITNAWGTNYLWSQLPWDVDLTWTTYYGGDYPSDPWSRRGLLGHADISIQNKNFVRQFNDLLWGNDQMDQLIDEFAAIIDPPGAALSMVDADRAMWDWHWVLGDAAYPMYLNQPASHKAGQNRFYLAAQNAGLERSFAGMVQLMKNYVVARRAYMENLCADAAIPNTPTIAYTGSMGWPINDLHFGVGAFSDPQGAGTFGAMAWRVAEVEPFSEHIAPPDSFLLIPQTAAWRYFKGTEEPSAQTGAWRLADYNDDPASTGWLAGDAPVGYDSSVAMGTRLSDMRYKYSTFYLRREFEITDPAAVGSLKLYAMYDDGFNAWINGTRVAFAPAIPEDLPCNAQLDLLGFGARENNDYVEFVLANPADYLVAGTNIIAVHVYNANLSGSSDCFFDLRLVAEPPSGQDPPSTVLRRPGRYEITPVWESGEVAAYQNTFAVPASELRAGRTYRVRARFKDNTQRWSHWSDPVQFVAGKPISAGIVQNLRITEVMYNPAAGEGSGFNKDDFEFIELKNIGDEVLDLTGVSFTSGVTFDFGAHAIATLAPGEFVLVVKNQAAFENRYGTALSPRIAGSYTGNLSNSGENLRLEDFWNGVIAEFEYGDGWGWPQAADGGGHSLVPLDAALPGQPEGSGKYGGNWRASAYIHGSPGADDPTQGKTVVVNEIMAHTDYFDPARPEYDSNDWIELYNAGGSPVALSGDWYLSDNINDLKKWALPNVNIAAGGFVSFDEVSGFHNPITTGFGLNKAGENVLLSYLPGTGEDRIVDAVRFKGQDVTMSYGRYPDGGDYWFGVTPTRDTANAAPAAGVVISEIMYHPVGDNEPYLELYNPTTSSVALFGPDGPWRIDGIAYTFGQSVWIAAGAKVVLAAFDPAAEPARLNAFMDTYGVTGLVANVNIFGPFPGNLSNSGERLAIERPLAVDLPNPDVPWVVVDEVIYGDYDPWPTTPDGKGDALKRIEGDSTTSGSDPANWQAAAPSPGE